MTALPLSARRSATMVAIAFAISACGPRSLTLPVTVRGHGEVALAAGGRLTPLMLDTDREVGLCVEVPDTRDTSRWFGQLLFDGRPSPNGTMPPAARLGRTLCFDGQPPSTIVASPKIALCLQVEDRFDNTSWRLPCISVAYRPSLAAARQRAAKEHAALLQALADQPLAARIEALDGFADRLARQGLHLLAVNVDLIAIHWLAGDDSSDSLDEARRRLDALPSWIEQPEASLVGATAYLERARLIGDAEHDVAHAWPLLDEANRRYLRIARPERFAVALERAVFLSRLGALQEAREQLLAALAECAQQSCNHRLLAQAKSEVAWLTTLDTGSSDSDLSHAEELLVAAAETLPADERPIEHAIQQINLAFVRLRLGRSPAPSLRAARSILEPLAGNTQAEDLLGWADLAEGLAHLEAGRLDDATTLCRKLTEHAEGTVAAWALSCLGRAARSRGDLAAAGRFLARAVALQELSAADLAAEGSHLSPGRRADDVAEAARVAVERGDAGTAWALLSDLDRMAADETARARCRAGTDSKARHEWQSLDRQLAALRRQWLEIERLPSGARRTSADAVAEQLRQEIRTLWRTWPGCSRRPADDAETDVRFRALALPDEVLLLERIPTDHTGTVRLVRRTPFPRAELQQRIEEVDKALSEGGLNADAWLDLVEPLGTALLPSDEATLGPVTVYALYGVLQRVPVAALPLRSTNTDHRWLGLETAVALRPVTGALAADRNPEATAPLFVVDPQGDLAGSTAQAAAYRSWFPNAQVLVGPEATSEHVLALWPTARWLHVDGHASQGAGFPELSYLALADRPLSLLELADQPTDAFLANLSGCRTGHWPVTADSGRFGIGGTLIRLGVSWVIAATHDLDDRTAKAFNRAFYDQLHRGVAVPDAYRRALKAVADSSTPARWASLVLLAGTAARENVAVRTPEKVTGPASRRAATEKP